MQYGIPESPAFKTSSKWRAWWLHSIRGYTLVGVQRQPKAGWFGRLAYDAEYLLIPKDTRH